MTSNDDNADREAQKAAEARRSAALERLVAGMAHDFRNILAVIKGNIELAIRRTDDSRVTSLLIEADRAAVFGAAMTDELLAFAQRGRGSTVQIDVAALVEGSLALLRATAGELVAFSLTARPDAGSIVADACAFERVLINLVANARDAMPSGGEILIEVTGDVVAEPLEILSCGLDVGKYVRLTVADGGPGMSEAVRRRALDPFFTTKPPWQGFGLGLSLVSEFATQAGGGVDIQTSPGGGALVTLYLKSR